MSKPGVFARAVALYKQKAAKTPIALVCKFNKDNPKSKDKLPIDEVKFACDKEHDCKYKICPFDGCANKNISLDDYIKAKKESGAYFEYS